MGYCSTIYAAKPYDFPEHQTHLLASELEGMLELWEAGFGGGEENADIKALFDTESNFSLYIEGNDDDMAFVKEDKYGNRLVYASDTEALYKAVSARSRKSPALRKLKKFIEIFMDDDEVCFVHYGH